MATALWLLGYFTLNLTLTLYNKLVLTHFPFPYTLTALHALCGSIGSFLLTPVPQLNGTKERIVLLLFSTLYTLNIVVSNASLRLVTLPFHQCVRASAPAFVLLIQTLRLPRSGSRCSPSKRKLLTLIPVIFGVALATYGDYYFTKSGFALTLLGTFLAALKTVITNVLVRASRPPQRALFSADEPYGTDSGKHAQSRLYSPLSPTAPFRFPYSPMITIAHRSSDSSGSSDCPDTLPRTRTSKPRPLSLSAFNPEGAIDDKAPSIPTPISSSLPSTTQTGRYFTHSTPDAMAIISSEHGLGPSTPQSAPPSPHVLHTTFPASHSYYGSGNASGGSTNASSTATTNRTVSVRALSMRGPQSCSHNVNTIDLEKKVDTKHPYHSHSHRRWRPWIPHPKFTEMCEYIHTLPTLHLTPLQLLSLLSPLAFVQCVALAWVSGELDDVNAHLHRRVSHSSDVYPNSNSFLASEYSWSWVHSSVPLGFGFGFEWLGRFGSLVGLYSLGVDMGWLVRGQTPWLIANAVLAFALNVVSFGANKRVGAVGMSVAANTKQALTLLLSITLFNLTLAPLNLVGIVCALLGGAAYAWVEVMEGRVGRGGVV